MLAAASVLSVGADGVGDGVADGVEDGTVMLDKEGQSCGASSFLPSALAAAVPSWVSGDPAVGLLKRELL